MSPIMPTHQGTKTIRACSAAHSLARSLLLLLPVPGSGLLDARVEDDSLAGLNDFLGLLSLAEGQ